MLKRHLYIWSEIVFTCRWKLPRSSPCFGLHFLASSSGILSTRCIVPGSSPPVLFLHFQFQSLVTFLSAFQVPAQIKALEGSNRPAVHNLYSYKQDLCLTEMPSAAAFSAAHQVRFKGCFWFPKETLLAPFPALGSFPPMQEKKKGQTCFCWRRRNCEAKHSVYWLWREMFVFH